MWAAVIHQSERCLTVTKVKSRPQPSTQPSQSFGAHMTILCLPNLLLVWKCFHGHDFDAGPESAHIKFSLCNEVDFNKLRLLIGTDLVGPTSFHLRDAIVTKMISKGLDIKVLVEYTNEIFINSTEKVDFSKLFEPTLC